MQLVWDAIALHTERSIAYYKEEEVRVVSQGIRMDFSGVDESFGVTREEYEGVVREFPRGDLKAGVNETIVWLCSGKAGSTYGEFLFLMI